MEVTLGRVQGSILGPDLWNASYDSLLKLDMPEESCLVGYADDIAALVAGHTVEQAQSRFDILMRRVKGWMTTHDFDLALEKTEVVILTKERISTLRPISFADAIIESKPAVKYLGLTLGSKMSFLQQIKEAANKTATGVSALSRLIANIEGPTSSRQPFLDEFNAICPALRRRVGRYRLPILARRYIVSVSRKYRGEEPCGWHLRSALSLNGRYGGRRSDPRCPSS